MSDKGVFDSAIINSLGFLRLIGDWNANTNTPTLASGVGTVGDAYHVSVAGTTNLDGTNVWNVRDIAYFSASNTWKKIDNTDLVTSVDGEVGPVDGRFSQAIFFGKGGDDLKDGKSYITRKLTLASAKTAASALTPAADNQIAISCQDAGTYSESYTNVAFVHLIAPAFKITGNIICAENCIMIIGTLNGDLTVDAAKVLRCQIFDIFGSVTKNGKIRGMVGDDLYRKDIIFEA